MSIIQRFVIFLTSALLALVAVAPASAAGPDRGAGLASRFYGVTVDGVTMSSREVTGGAVCITERISNVTAVHPDKSPDGKPPACQELSVMFPTNLDPAVAQWINDSWDGTGGSKDLRVCLYNQNGSQVWDRTFSHCTISQVVIPGCGSNASPIPFFQVTFTPQGVSDTTSSQQPGGSGRGPQADLAAALWYGIMLDGVGSVGLTEMEPITVKTQRSASSPGAGRTSTDVGDLNFTIPYDGSSPLLAWVKSFSGGEKQGTLISYDPKGSQVFTVDLHNVGAKSYEYVTDGTGRPSVKIGLYVEGVHLQMPAMTGSQASSGSPATTAGSSMTDKSAAALAPKTGLSLPTPVRSTSTSQIKTPRKLGALEITLMSVDYSTAPQPIGGMRITPAAGQKILVVRYELRNSSSNKVSLTGGSVGFVATGSSGATYTGFTIGIGGGSAQLTTALLAPEDILSCVAMKVIPASETVTKLTVVNTAETASTTYTFGQ